MPHPVRSTLATLVIVGFVIAGCSSDDDGATLQEGMLSVCSDIPYEPFEFEGDGPSGYTGFDIELLDAVATANDLELSVADVEFDGILGNLEAGTCDVVASAVTITDERAEQADFTDPYFDAEQSLLVKSDSGIAGLDDLTGATIGVQSGTTGESYANDNTPQGAEIKAFDGADALFAAIESEDIDAILQDFPVNAYRATQDDTVEVVEEFTTDEQYGFAIKKDNGDLLTMLNDGLDQVRSDGDYDSLYETYFGTQPGA